MVLNLILIAIAVALDPLPLTAFLIVLQSEKGARKGAAFVFGWLASLAVVVAITVGATGGKPPKTSTAPSIASLVVRALIGALLIAIAVRQRRRQGLPKKPKKQPKWQAGVDRMSPWFAMGLAPALQPWGLIAAGAATVVNANTSQAAGVVSLLVFCLLASGSYLSMEVYSLVRPEESLAFLTRSREWIDSHTDQVIIFGALALGLWLVVNSVYLLFS